LYGNIQKLIGNIQKYSKSLDADCADYAEKYSHKKAQKTSAFASAVAKGLWRDKQATADRQREIRRRLPKLTPPDYCFRGQADFFGY
jgi:hypothetical protein